MRRVAAVFAAVLVALAAPIARAQDPMVQLGSVGADTAGDYEAGIIQANGAYSYIVCSWDDTCVAKVRGMGDHRQGAVLVWATRRDLAISFHAIMHL